MQISILNLYNHFFFILFLIFKTLEMKKKSIISSKSVAAIKVPENSTLSLDEYAFENKQDNIHNSENTSATANESNEKCTYKSRKDLEITDVNNVCSSAVSKEHTKLENNLFIKNHTHINHDQNEELTIHKEENLKEAANDDKKIISINNYELNKLGNVDHNISSINFTNIKSEKLSTTATVSNSNDENLENKIVDKHIKNNHSLKRSYVELNNDSDYEDLGNFKDLSSCKDTVTHKSKKKNSESVNVTENKNALNISKFAEKAPNTSLIQNQNNPSNIKDNTEVTNENRNVNKSVTQTIDNNLMLQNVLLVSSDADNSNNEKGTKNVDTVVPRRKRIKKTSDTVQDRSEEDKQGRKYLTSKAKYGISSVSVKRLKKKHFLNLIEILTILCNQVQYYFLISKRIWMITCHFYFTQKFSRINI